MERDSETRQSRFLRVIEFCKEARISRTKAYALVHDRKVPHVLIGETIRIPRSALDQLEREAMSNLAEK